MSWYSDFKDWLNSKVEAKRYALISAKRGFK